ncbi:MAG: UTRA domain-containing protein [Hungatella sp.]|nr:UTRA domain-containing protein [Hungatella sp.]
MYTNQVLFFQFPYISPNLSNTSPRRSITPKALLWSIRSPCLGRRAYTRSPAFSAASIPAEEIAKASPEQAQKLGIPTGEPLLFMNCYFIDQNSHPLCIGRQYYVGSRYMFEL